MLSNEAVLFVDWLNLSIQLKNQRLAFGADLVSDLIAISKSESSSRGLQLTRAHFVSESFSEQTAKAISRSLVAIEHKTRTAKEQADLQMSVLAMDHLHAPEGCPALFILATGDQDFIPLIRRIVLENAEIILVVASTSRLAPEYRSVAAAEPKVTLLQITDRVNLRPLPTVSGDRSALCVLGLFRVCLSGGVLGGAQDRNTKLLSQWGILTPGADEELEAEGLIKQFTRVEQRRVAIPAKRLTGNRSALARRTVLNFGLESVRSAIDDADWILRRASNPLRPASIGDVAVGHFNDDNGTRLELVLTAMCDVGWLLERSDGRFEATAPWSSDGLLEPLWRIVAEVNRRAHEHRSTGVARDDLFSDLRSSPIARDPERKGGSHAAGAIDFARRIGVIDAIPAGKDGYALAVIEGHPISRQVEKMLKTISQMLSGRVGVALPEHELLGMMRDRDEQADVPIFGHDVRDRQRVLRVFRRSRLIGKDNASPDGLIVKWSAWVRKLAG